MDTVPPELSEEDPDDDDRERDRALSGDGERQRETIVRTIGEVADILGLSATQVKEHLRNGCPGKAGDRGKQNGRFLIREILAWMRENPWKPKAPGGDLLELETQKLAADVRLANLRADKMAATLVERGAVLAQLTTICNVIRARLDQLPMELSNAVPVKMRTEFKRDVSNKINLIKKELAEIGGSGGID